MYEWESYEMRYPGKKIFFELDLIVNRLRRENSNQTMFL